MLAVIGVSLGCDGVQPAPKPKPAPAAGKAPRRLLVAWAQAAPPQPQAAQQARAVASGRRCAATGLLAMGEALQQGRGSLKAQARVCVGVKRRPCPESGLLVVSVAIIEHGRRSEEAASHEPALWRGDSARHAPDRRSAAAGHRAVRDVPAAGGAAGRLHR